MNYGNKIYIVQGLDDQIWKREAVFTELDDAKDHAEFLAIGHRGKFFRVVDDETSPDEDKTVYKLLQF